MIFQNQNLLINNIINLKITSPAGEQNEKQQIKI